MASKISSPSQTLNNFQSLSLEPGSITTDQPSTMLSRQLSDIIVKSTQEDLSSVSTANNSKDSTTGAPSHYRHPVDTSEKKPMASNGDKHTKIALTFGLKSKNKTEDKTLVPTNGKESVKKEISEKKSTTSSNKEEIEGIDEKVRDQDQNLDDKDSSESQVDPKEKARKIKKLFSKFSVSLSIDRIQADLVSMGLSKRTKRPKKRRRSAQKQLDDLFPGLGLKSITLDRYQVRDAN